MCVKILGLITVIFIFLTVTKDAHAYKILGVFPMAAPSHYFLGSQIMMGLAEAGHDVTMLTVFEEKNPPKNGKYNQIVMKDLYEEQQAMFRAVADFKNKQDHGMFNNPVVMLMTFNQFGYTIAEKTLNNTKTQDLLKSEKKFDVVIVPQFILDSLKGFAAYFDAHLVLFNPIAASSWMNHFVGNPSLPSLNPEFALQYISPMNFKQRLLNTVFTIFTYLNHNLLQYPSQDKLVRKYISKDIDLEKVAYNVSLVLSNSHPSLNPVAGAVPCMKEIAGFHVKPSKPLPEDLKKYLDEAKNGVIYFSMGSNLKSADLPIIKREALMKAFSKRKENILWKFEVDDMPGKPNNVRIEKWLPQSDLLAHPNIKLFITHGGFLSTVETVYNAVPTVAIPILGDQMLNAKMAERHGFTKVVEFTKLSEETISDAIEEVLTNKKYLENVRSRSKIFHDRPIPALQEAIYWIEYVVRHNGAQHLRVSYLDLAWYQWYMLDVFGLIFAVLFMIIFVTKKIISLLCKICTNNKKPSKKVKKQ
ncbi:unnamed protein product [Diabrotica balteata]|uniref:UDP-glucuronosyltransferase n=1 Tax=Diabrotica balteata TaxID=107213 RepID=A0A9N9T4U2_DIABA|nr:unnamed protein product [Diabrotica balteata]